MGAARQRTLKAAIGCAGVGLHGGEKVAMRLVPAPADSGIVLRRIDLGGAEIAARHTNIVSSTMCTTLGDGNGVGVATVEHLMAALAGLGVDNAVIELDGPEVPIMDGSAAPFVFLIECAGIVEQAAPRRVIEVLKPVVVSEGARAIRLMPAAAFSLTFAIAYEHPVIGRQSCAIALVDGAFKREIARARTYGFLSDVDRLRGMGLVLGGSLDNAVVLDDDGVINDEGLRYADELVRYKALDCIGDLYLAGAPLMAHVEATASGHGLNARLLEALFADETAWRLVTLDEAVERDWPADQPIAATA